MIEFVITGVDDKPNGSVDAQSNPIRYRMANVEEIHLERTNLYRFTSANVDQFGFLTEVAAVELVLIKPLFSGVAYTGALTYSSR
jgi:hypothetical protein